MRRCMPCMAWVLRCMLHMRCVLCCVPCMLCVLCGMLRCILHSVLRCILCSMLCVLWCMLHMQSVLRCMLCCILRRMQRCVLRGMLRVLRMLLAAPDRVCRSDQATSKGPHGGTCPCTGARRCSIRFPSATEAPQQIVARGCRGGARRVGAWELRRCA